MPEFKFNEVQETWLQALESEEMQDKQGRDYLIRDGKMCCLGVFCSLQPDVTRVNGSYFIYKDSYMVDSLNHEVMVERSRLRSSCGMFKTPYTSDRGVYYGLTDMNDRGKFTFREIAAYIRQHPENVFIGSNTGD